MPHTLCSTGTSLLTRMTHVEACFSNWNATSYCKHKAALPRRMQRPLNTRGGFQVWSRLIPVQHVAVYWGQTSQMSMVLGCRDQGPLWGSCPHSHSGLILGVARPLQASPVPVCVGAAVGCLDMAAEGGSQAEHPGAYQSCCQTRSAPLPVAGLAHPRCPRTPHTHCQRSRSSAPLSPFRHLTSPRALC